MTKDEFIKLLNNKDDISHARVLKMLSQYVENTEDETDYQCLEALCLFDDIEEYLDFICENVEDSVKPQKPYTLDDARDILQTILIDNLVSTLED